MADFNFLAKCELDDFTSKEVENLMVWLVGKYDLIIGDVSLVTNLLISPIFSVGF